MDPPDHVELGSQIYNKDIGPQKPTRCVVSSESPGTGKNFVLRIKFKKSTYLYLQREIYETFLGRCKDSINLRNFNDCILISLGYIKIIINNISLEYDDNRMI